MVFATVHEALGAARVDDQNWHFDLGGHLNSVWGGVHGGAVAAATLVAARGAAESRSPMSLDIRLLRYVLAGPAQAASRVVHRGRTLTTVQVELTDEGARTTAVALATFVERSALATDIAREPEARSLAGDVNRSDDEHLTKSGIVQLLDVDETYVPGGHGWDATPITVPWEVRLDTGPEAVCMAADLVQGGAAYRAVEGHGLATPNVDLSLRFTGADPDETLVGYAQALGWGAGALAVQTVTWSGKRALGHSLSSCVLMRG